MSERLSVIEPLTAVERIESLSGRDLHDLCDATDAAIDAGGGFGWLSPPPRQTLESYWKGVLLVPERKLFVARLDKVIAGSAQLQRNARNNEAQAEVGQITSHFLAPWARGHGLAGQMIEAIEAAARAESVKVLNLDVRETQERAIQVYQSLGFKQWGHHPRYARAGGTWVGGLYFTKSLDQEEGTAV